tara:strand:- start:504 stop:758 length:255 start_codon:yes stop_codon:yes gene_type:complete
MNRNDKCNCGSGKKYKHCCQNKSSNSNNSNYIKFAIIASVFLLIAFSIYGVYESYDYPEQEFYKCDNPNCTQLHRRVINNNDSE